VQFDEQGSQLPVTESLNSPVAQPSVHIPEACKVEPVGHETQLEFDRSEHSLQVM